MPLVRPAKSGYDPRALASLVLMDAARMGRTLSRIAHEILERHPRVSSLALVGVRTRGVPLAQRLARLIGETSSAEPAVGALDITLYRDDFTTIAPQPLTKGTDILFSIDGRTVVLVDDVLFTGRTVRAALDQLIDFGRPARIELAVLVDRGHRELPIRADYVGRTLSTARDEVVQVLVREEDGRDEIVLRKKGRAPRPPRAKASQRGVAEPTRKKHRSGARRTTTAKTRGATTSKARSRSGAGTGKRRRR
jgi:pyrimidine operon attenuation protein/uracil phosphoribosyltransferase